MKLVISVLLAGALIVGGIFYFRDTDGPRIELIPPGGAVSAKRSLSLHLEDPGSGLKSLEIKAVQGDTIQTVLSEAYPAGTGAQEKEVNLQGISLEDGPFTLEVVARDHSIYRFGAGNMAEETFSFNYDSKAPILSVVSTAHNLNQGGSGLIVFSVSEEVEHTGVQVGEIFFPAYRQESGNWVCLFALPYFMSPKDFAPEIIAVDKAGNERRTGFYYHANARNFPAGRINLDDRFLNVLLPRFEALYPQSETPLELYLNVNRDLRRKNVEALRRFGLQTSPEPLWEGAFLRQPNAANLGGFADARSYFYKGKKVDAQTHLGVDLASVSQAPVPAANAGKVVFADDLGIYGLCVIIDHGLGLQSLYGHLSRIVVNAEDTVEKGQIIGNSGATGLAGGDHLHFETIVSGISVNPVEWWDQSWIRNNIEGKMAQTRPE